MGIEALYRKPRTTKQGAGHKVSPYLLHGLAIDRPNQVWAMDITYLPMARGFVCLAAVVDWHTRRVLAWEVSITMEAHFCVETGEESIQRYGAPEIMNTDQGCQVTSQAFNGLMKEHDTRVSLDGKGAWRDNVFVERLWRTAKDEDVYLRAYESVSAAKAGLRRYCSFDNSLRPHSSLDGQTPDQVYSIALSQTQAA
jgi:putative transposase